MAGQGYIRHWFKRRGEVMKRGKFQAIRSLSCVALWVLIVILLAGYVFGAEPTEQDKIDYQAALSNSAVYTPAKVYRKLLAIVRDPEDPVNKARLHGGSISWEQGVDNPRVKVVAAIAAGDYANIYRSKMADASYPLSKSLWVTVAPEMQNYFMCSGACPPTAKRIRQLLGLQLTRDYDVLVEFWIDPRYLFRPSPDPEITDHEAEVILKDAGNNWIYPADRYRFSKYDSTMLYKEAGYRSCASEPPVSYANWFVNRINTIYIATGDPTNPANWGYPWTSLGYTYDWGDPNNHVGLSEFVVMLEPHPADASPTECLAGTWYREVKLERAIGLTSEVVAQYPELIPAASYFSCQLVAGQCGDIDGDGKVGLQDAIRALQVVSGMRNQ
jgi:hypothetical protein